jgi:hypothetical protein
MSIIASAIRVSWSMLTAYKVPAWKLRKAVIKCNRSSSATGHQVQPVIKCTLSSSGNGHQVQTVTKCKQSSRGDLRYIIGECHRPWKKVRHHIIADVVKKIRSGPPNSAEALGGFSFQISLSCCFLAILPYPPPKNHAIQSGGMVVRQIGQSLRNQSCPLHLTGYKRDSGQE